MGLGHDFDTVVEAMALLARRADPLAVHRRRAARARAARARRARAGPRRACTFLPYRAARRAAVSLTAADASLVTPARRARRPARAEQALRPARRRRAGGLRRARPTGRVAEVVRDERVGVAVRNGDARGLAAAIRALRDDRRRTRGDGPRAPARSSTTASPARTRSTATTSCSSASRRAMLTLTPIAGFARRVLARLRADAVRRASSRCRVGADRSAEPAEDPRAATCRASAAWPSPPRSTCRCWRSALRVNLYEGALYEQPRPGRRAARRRAGHPRARRLRRSARRARADRSWRCRFPSQRWPGGLGIRIGGTADPTGAVLLVRAAPLARRHGAVASS